MTTSDIDAFIAANQRPKPSRFLPYADDINRMLVADITYAKILEWLARPPRNVVGLKGELSKWLKRQEARQLKNAAANQVGAQAAEPVAPGYRSAPARKAPLARRAPAGPTQAARVDAAPAHGYAPEVPGSKPISVANIELVKSSQRDRDDSSDTPLKQKTEGFVREQQRSISLRLPPKIPAPASQQNSPI